MQNKPNTLKDSLRERRLFRVRAMVALMVVVLLLIGVAGRFFQLQVLRHDAYITRSEANRVKLRAIAPTRGLIFDSNGLLVAENRPAYRLEVVPEQVENLSRTLKQLRQVIDVSDEDLKEFHKLLSLKREFHSIPLRFNLSDREVARFAANRYKFTGVDVVPHLTRSYPLGEHLAHVVGYVGRINAQELRELDPAQYSASSHVGKTGIERTYESILHGSVGYEKVEVNAQGRVLRTLERTDPEPGHNLYLNLDAGLQITAEAAFQGYAGSVVALDPHTGAVKALVSVPAFDPNLFVGGIDAKTYRALNTSPRAPLFNRALAGTYPPGSTFKPFMGLAGLELGFREPDENYYCPGFFRLPGEERRYRDWKRQGHGQVNLHRSIVESCDVYYYKLAVDMGIDRIHDYMQQFGFGWPTGIDTGPERDGLMPSRDWKQRTRGLPWFPGETVITGIGQGFILATPLQLAVATATLASRGVRPTPQLVAAVEDSTTGEREELNPVPAGRVQVHNPQNWERVVHAMEDVVQSIHGTARRIATDQYSIAGKTGTAQVFGLPQDSAHGEEQKELLLRDHALFIAFAPADDPQIAVAVVVEHGGGGGTVAAPVAGAVIDAYLNRPHEAADDADQGGGP